MTTPRTTTIEQERQKDLDEYRQELIEDKEESLKLGSENKEEPLDQTVHNIAIAEATAGKIKLPTLIPIKTIRLDIDKFTAFFSKKFYRVKLDYDLYLEVNADNPQECVEKIVKFAQVMLKGMLPMSEGDMEIEELVPGMRNKIDESDYDLS